MNKITLDGTKNTRDLGGFYPKNTIFIKKKMLIRSDALSQLSPQDIIKLKDELHLKTVFDFRGVDESNRHPDIIIDGVKNISLPLIPPQDILEGITSKEESSQMSFTAKLRVLYQRGIKRAAYEVMKNNYTTLLSDKYSVSKMKKFLHYIIDNSDGGSILFHCAGGKDRTGVATLIILSLLGVSEEEIIDDYMQTNNNVKVHNDAIINAAKKDGDWIKAEILDATMNAHEEYIKAAIELSKNKEKSTIEYIKKTFDINEGDILNLKRRLLR